MNNKSVTIEHARKRLGKRAESMTNAQIEDLLKQLRLLSNKTIDSVVKKVNKG